jgi:UDP-glucose:(heptosyl)LPS alpha-1,3-glucosyltransferase
VIAYPWFALCASLMVRRHRRGIVQATGAIVLNRVDFIAVHFCHRAVARRGAVPSGSRSTGLFRAHAKASHTMSRLGERFCLRRNRVGGIIAVSPGVAAEVRDCYPGLGDRVAVIANGVDRTAFSPASSAARRAARLRLGLPPLAPCAAFVGGDWGRKGLQTVIESLSEAEGWHLVVAGRGDEVAFGRLAAGAGATGRVHFLGTTNDTVVVYHAANAFVLPTAYETFSLVTYEAAASGLPLIATAVSGIEDILVDGVTGYRVERDRHEIALRLNQLAGAPDLALEMGAAARRATAPYTWPKMVAHHRALYEQAGR